MRYTCDQLMMVQWYMTINSDINSQELSDKTSRVDSSGNFQCHYNNNMVTIISDCSCYNAITIFQGSILKSVFTITRFRHQYQLFKRKWHSKREWKLKILKWILMLVKISFTYIPLRKGINNIQFETMVYFNDVHSQAPVVWVSGCHLTNWMNLLSNRAILNILTWVGQFPRLQTWHRKQTQTWWWSWWGFTLQTYSSKCTQETSHIRPFIDLVL